jgi:hypothetical protein
MDHTCVILNWWTDWMPFSTMKRWGQINLLWAWYKFAYEVGPHHRTKHEHFYDTNMSPYLFPFLWNCMVWTVDVDGLHPYIPFLCKKVSNHVHTPVHNTWSTTPQSVPNIPNYYLSGCASKVWNQKRVRDWFPVHFNTKVPKIKIKIKIPLFGRQNVCTTPILHRLDTYALSKSGLWTD